MRSILALGFAAALLFGGALPIDTASAEDETDKGNMQELAKQSQNPIASLISVPFENNINYNAGPLNKTDNTTTAKPVYPAQLTEDWNLINRALIPIVSLGSRAPGMDRKVGLGDITYQGFLSPAKGGDVLWGVGPTFVARTATNDFIGSNKWSLGPNVVVVATPGNWVVGALAFNVWSVAGDPGSPNVNQSSLQYFVNYNFESHWYLTTAPTMTANWKSSKDDKFTIPVGGGLGKVFRFGEQPLNARVAAYYNAERPEQTADWQISAQLTFLFPK